MIKNKKIIFIDTEFTGEKQNTTLISIGIVTLDKKKLYITLSDYDKSQVTPWVKKNVLSKIDEKNSIKSKEAYKKINNFLKKYSDGQKICVVSYGLMQDIMLFYELYKFKDGTNKKKFHYLKNLPKYLKTGNCVDLSTLFQVVGYKSNLSRTKFVGVNNKDRHSAIFDAEVARLCFLKLIKKKIFKNFISNI